MAARLPRLLIDRRPQATPQVIGHKDLVPESVQSVAELMSVHGVGSEDEQFTLAHVVP